MATDNPVQRQMLNAGMHILNLANELTKASESGAENGPKTAVDATVGAMKKFAAQVINGAAFIGSCLTHEEVAEAENVTLYDIEKAKAQQESLERLEPFFRGIRQRMSEDKARSDAVQTEQMELVATLEDEVIRLKKEIDELTSSHAANLQRVRAEAERAIKEAEERSVATSAEIVLPRPRRTKTTGRSRDDESGLVTVLEEELTQKNEEIEDLKAELQRVRAETKAQPDRRVDHREETGAVLETTTDHLSVETAVAIEDEETSAATIEAAAETETATALDLDNAGVNSTIDTNAIVRLVEVAENSKDKLIAGKLPILRMVQDIFEAVFKIENHKDLHQNLRCLSSQLLSILCPLPALNNQFAESMNAEAEQMKIESGVMLNAGFGTILSQCETIKSEVEANEANSKGVRDMAFAIKEALFRAKCDNDEEGIRDAMKKADEDVKSFINRVVSKTYVKDNLSIGNATRYLMVHVLDSFLVVDFLSRISIRMAYQHLSKASDLIKRAKEFAQKANAGVPFDESMTALCYLFSYVSPVMGNENEDLKEEAWSVTDSLFYNLNQVVSVGKTATDEEKENDPRMKQITSLLREVECGTYTGRKDENATVYLSGVGKAYNAKRKKAFRTVSVFFLRPLIERHLPPGFFAKFGYTRSFLRLPISFFGRVTTFIEPDFYSEPGKYMGNFDSIVKKVQKGEDKGERTIFIQSAEQRESLKRLVEIHGELVN